MNKLQFKQLIREEIRKVLKESSLKEGNSITGKLQDVYSDIYEYEDDGLEILDMMVDNANLTKIFDKWLNNNSSISDMEAKKLLKVFKDALDEIKEEL